MRQLHVPDPPINLPRIIVTQQRQQLLEALASFLRRHVRKCNHPQLRFQDGLVELYADPWHLPQSRCHLDQVVASCAKVRDASRKSLSKKQLCKWTCCRLRGQSAEQDLENRMCVDFSGSVFTRITVLCCERRYENKILSRIHRLQVMNAIEECRCIGTCALGLAQRQQSESQAGGVGLSRPLQQGVICNSGQAAHLHGWRDLPALLKGLEDKQGRLTFRNAALSLRELGKRLQRGPGLGISSGGGQSFCQTLHHRCRSLSSNCLGNSSPAPPMGALLRPP
mmetsp:Transcript_36270/g.67008  ORF Transcript_36270/g.67008 Transcript_36270/m.67008 type:complete len:281 (+) Transcript_36270:128-970(+)